jgi:adenine phosphoribosyltransferase
MWNGHVGLNAARESVFKGYIRDIPDFPKKGILFRDITPLLGNGDMFKRAIVQMCGSFKNMGVDYIACIEARGFLIGAAVANELSCGLIPIRKKGKLPHTVCSESYGLEYGTDILEMHVDALKNGPNNKSDDVLIIDDVLATGGTAKAAIKLINNVGGNVVGAAFLLELSDLNGRSNLPGVNVYSLISY